MKLKRLVPFLLVVVILVNSVGLVLADDTTNYTYDANGNLLSDGVQCFNYNDANQLAAVQTCATNALIAEYVYDHTGQRIIEKHYQNGVLQETVYTIGKQAETVVAAGGARQDTTYYRANSEIVARESADGSKVFYHQDHLGSTGALTDAGGQLVEETRYYPFGAVRTGGALSRFLYTGQESDAETGLYYYGARFYDPALARFVQPDSMLPEPYDPQQLNRYAYVSNNPLIYVDPTGQYQREKGLIEEGDTKDDITQGVETELGVEGLTWDQIVSLSGFESSDPRQLIGQKTRLVRGNVGRRIEGDLLDFFISQYGDSWASDINKLGQYSWPVKIILFLKLNLGDEADLKTAFFDEEKFYIVDGELGDWSILGNFMFGYTGNELGISPILLHLGSTVVNKAQHGSWDSITDTRAINQGIGYSRTLRGR